METPWVMMVMFFVYPPTPPIHIAKDRNLTAGSVNHGQWRLCLISLFDSSSISLSVSFSFCSYLSFLYSHREAITPHRIMKTTVSGWMSPISANMSFSFFFSFQNRTRSEPAVEMLCFQRAFFPLYPGFIVQFIQCPPVPKTNSNTMRETSRLCVHGSSGGGGGGDIYRTSQRKP